jgi:hypothetical protein
MLDNNDIQQISKLLDEKFKERDKLLDERFEKNNKILVDDIMVKVDARFDEVLGIMNDSFTDMEVRMDGFKQEISGKVDKIEAELGIVKVELEKKPNKSDMFSWGDKQILPVKFDVDRLKYIHLKEIKKLPPQYEISQALADNDLKEKQG